MLARPLLAVLALLVVFRATAAEPAREAPPRVIRVSGEGRVSVAPDVAVVHVGVEATGKDLARTVTEASARMRRVLSALEAAGVAAREVRTTRHDVQVQRAWEKGREGEITGYAVHDEARVVVRELGKLGSVLAAVVSAGSNSLRGLAFEKDDPAPARREALGRAVAEAREKALAIAEASGVALGEVLEIAEAGAAGPIPFERRAAVAAIQAEGVPVSPGELEIVAGVNATYAIR